MQIGKKYELKKYSKILSRRELFKTVEFLVRVHLGAEIPFPWHDRVTVCNPGYRQVFHMSDMYH